MGREDNTPGTDSEELQGSTACVREGGRGHEIINVEETMEVYGFQQYFLLQPKQPDCFVFKKMKT